MQNTSELKVEMTALRQQFELAQNEIRAKEEKINQLLKEVHSLVRR